MRRMIDFDCRGGRLVSTLNEADGDVGLLIVSGDSEQCVRAIWQAAAEQGTVIRSLIPARNSMENIFLEAVQSMPQQSNHADS